MTRLRVNVSIATNSMEFFSYNGPHY